jgi:hypothetical protein
MLRRRRSLPQRCGALLSCLSGAGAGAGPVIKYPPPVLIPKRTSCKISEKNRRPRMRPAAAEMGLRQAPKTPQRAGRSFSRRARCAKFLEVAVKAPGQGFSPMPRVVVIARPKAGAGICICARIGRPSAASQLPLPAFLPIPNLFQCKRSLQTLNGFRVKYTQNLAVYLLKIIIL